MKTAVSLWVLIQLLSAADFRQGDDESAKIRGWIEKRFTFAAPDVQTGYVQRLSRALAALPADPETRRQALNVIEGQILEASESIKFRDPFREMLPKYPEMEPLVLPKEFYLQSYSSAVDRVDIEMGRALKRLSVPPEQTALIRTQLDQLSRDAEAIAQRSPALSETRAKMSRQIADIIDELKGVQDSPFYRFEKPLSEEQYRQVVAQFGDRVAKLPLLQDKPEGAVPGSGRKGEDDPEPENTGTQVVGDPRRVKSLLREASNALYAYTRLSDPERMAAIEHGGEIERRAKAWIDDAKAKHILIYNKIVQRDIIEPDIKKSEAARAEKEAAAAKGAKTPELPPALPPSREPVKKAAPADPPPDTRVRDVVVLTTCVLAGFLLWRSFRKAPPSSS